MMTAVKDEGPPKAPEDRLRSISLTVFTAATILLLFAGGWNLYMASAQGGSQGYDLAALFREWNKGLNLNGNYSAAYLMAMKRMTLALMQLALSGISLCGALIMAFVSRISARRD
jgi:hypothetical protein